MFACIFPYSSSLAFFICFFVSFLSCCSHVQYWRLHSCTSYAFSIPILEGTFFFALFGLSSFSLGIILFHSCCCHAQVFGKTLLQKFHFFYCQTEWYLFFSQTRWSLLRSKIRLLKVDYNNNNNNNKRIFIVHLM